MNSVEDRVEPRPIRVPEHRRLGWPIERYKVIPGVIIREHGTEDDPGNPWRRERRLASRREGTEERIHQQFAERERGKPMMMRSKHCSGMRDAREYSLRRGGSRKACCRRCRRSWTRMMKA